MFRTKHGSIDAYKLRGFHNILFWSRELQLKTKSKRERGEKLLYPRIVYKTVKMHLTPLLESYKTMILPAIYLFKIFLPIYKFKGPQVCWYSFLSAHTYLYLYTLIWNNHPALLSNSSLMQTVGKHTYAYTYGFNKK